MINKNKKGDIGITILVIGVFMVCTLALLTFYISDYKISNSFVGLDVMQKLNADIDLYKFYEANEVSEESLIRQFNLTKEGEEYYFQRKVEAPRFNLFSLETDTVLLFSVKYKIPS